MPMNCQTTRVLRYVVRSELYIAVEIYIYNWHRTDPLFSASSTAYIKAHSNTKCVQIPTTPFRSSIHHPKLYHPVHTWNPKAANVDEEEGVRQPMSGRAMKNYQNQWRSSSCRSWDVERDKTLTITGRRTRKSWRIVRSRSRPNLLGAARKSSTWPCLALVPVPPGNAPEVDRVPVVVLDEIHTSIYVYINA